jgi:hypothetical protein
VGEVGTVVLAEAELQDLHAGKADGMAQRVDVLGDEAEVFGDQRQVAERLTDRVEQRLAGTRHPTPVHGRLLGCRNLPVRGEAAKVIEADDVGQAQVGADARDPPAVIGLAQYLPPV